jgi:hypothetical protein
MRNVRVTVVTDLPTMFPRNTFLHLQGVALEEGITDPHGRILRFLDWPHYYCKWLLSCTHKAEWTPFQTHYFSENLAVLGIEPVTSGSILTTRPQKQSWNISKATKTIAAKTLHLANCSEYVIAI